MLLAGFCRETTGETALNTWEADAFIKWPHVTDSVHDWQHIQLLLFFPFLLCSHPSSVFCPPLSFLLNHTLTTHSAEHMCGCLSQQGNNLWLRKCCRLQHKRLLRKQIRVWKILHQSAEDETTCSDGPISGLQCFDSTFWNLISMLVTSKKGNEKQNGIEFHWLRYFL